MNFGIRNKVALVAAASRGLGYATAMELAREGAQVAVCGRDEQRIHRAAAELSASTGGRILPVVADVEKAQDCEYFIAQAAETLGSVDILVTNAGGPPAGFFDDIDDESWALGFERTMMSAIRLIRAALPHMREKKWGRIVAITSISVKQPIPGLLLSNALRPGVVGMAKSLADEVALEGITINAVCPGWTATERVDEILQARAESRGISKQEAAAEIEQSIPMRRMAKPEELAAMVTFLCSARASYITGTTIQVDGGAFRGLM